jgi:hypothetical protein
MADSETNPLQRGKAWLEARRGEYAQRIEEIDALLRALSPDVADASSVTLSLPPSPLGPCLYCGRGAHTPDAVCGGYEVDPPMPAALPPPSTAGDDLPPNEFQVFRAMQHGYIRLQDIADHEGMKYSRVNSAMQKLVMRGLVQRLGQGKYEIISGASSASWRGTGPGETATDSAPKTSREMERE